MRLCFDLSPANDSEITLPLESYWAPLYDFLIYFFPIVPHRPELQCFIQGEGGDFRLKWIVPMPSCKWSQLWLCKFRRGENETKRRVIKRRHQFAFTLKDHPCMCWCFVHNREGGTWKLITNTSRYVFRVTCVYVTRKLVWKPFFSILMFCATRSLLDLDKLKKYLAVKPKGWQIPWKD